MLERLKITYAMGEYCAGAPWSYVPCRTFLADRCVCIGSGADFAGDSGIRRQAMAYPRDAARVKKTDATAY